MLKASNIFWGVGFNFHRLYCVTDGQFGAEMQVLIQNDGPVTVQLESPAGPTDPKLVSSFDSQWKTCFNMIFYRSCQFCSSDYSMNSFGSI